MTETVISEEFAFSLPTMGCFKIFVCLLGVICACTAVPMTGYNCNRGHESSLTKILKAVLLRESTDNGVYSGSIGHGASGYITVTKQEKNLSGQNVDPDYPFAFMQQINGNRRGSIQVRHKSLGDNGYIQPQATPQMQIMKAKNDYQAPVRQQDGEHVSNFVSVSSSSPHFLQLSHSPLTYNSDKSQRQIAFLPTAAPPHSSYNNGRLGEPKIMNYQNAHRQQNLSGVDPTSFFDPATIFGSKLRNPSSLGFSSEAFGGSVLSHYNRAPLNGNTRLALNARSQEIQGYDYEKHFNTGYSYPNPGEAEQIEVSQYGTSKVNSIHHPKSYRPSLAQNIGTADIMHYIDRPSNENFNYNNLQLEAYAGKNQLSEQNQAHSNAAIQQNGYYYGKPTKIFHEGPPAEEIRTSTQDVGYQYYRPAVKKSVLKGQSRLPINSDLHPTGKQELSTQLSEQDGYKFRQPNVSSRPRSTFKGQSYLPLPPTSSRW